MKNVRFYGGKPYTVAVVHGGPGTAGSLARLARELSGTVGVLEPLQTKLSIDGQIAELADVLRKYAPGPVVLVGHSWGAILSCLTAARCPALARKLILVGTALLLGQERFDLTPVWLERLPERQRVEFLALEKSIWDGAAEDKSEPMGRLFRLIARAESFDPVPYRDETLQYRLDINMAVGLDMDKWMAGGEMSGLVKQIACPVVAVHGDYDPRPSGIVRESLAAVISNFRFILLEKCGHFPWLEKHARDKFFEILRKEIV